MYMTPPTPHPSRSVPPHNPDLFIFQDKASRAADSAKRKRQTLAQAGGAPPPPPPQAMKMVWSHERGGMVLSEENLVSIWLGWKSCIPCSVSRNISRLGIFVRMQDTHCIFISNKVFGYEYLRLVAHVLCTIKKSLCMQQRIKLSTNLLAQNRLRACLCLYIVLLYFT